MVPKSRGSQLDKQTHSGPEIDTLIDTLDATQIDLFSSELSPAERQFLEQVYIQDQHDSIDYYDAVLSAVVFDWNGLPQEYFMTSAVMIPWEKTVFQILGLRWLLMSSLVLEGFQHAKLAGPEHTVHIIRQQERYMALLLECSEERDASPSFLEWLWGFDLSNLRNAPRFQA